MSNVIRNVICTPSVLVMLLMGVGVRAGEPSTDPDASGKGSAPPPKRSTDQYRLTTISVAVSALNKEARESWSREKRWPRAESDFAHAKQWRIENDELVQGFLRKLDRNPAIDGYIKWQLLSFGPDFSAVEEKDVNRYVASLPEVLERPRPQVKSPDAPDNTPFVFFGRQITYIADLDPVVGSGAVAYKPRVGTVSDGSGFSADAYAEFRLEVRRANNRLAAARDMVQVANAPTLNYRDALIENLPVGTAMRFGMWAKEVRARMEVGDPSYMDAFEKLAETGKALRSDDSVSPNVRQTLAGWVVTLGRAQPQVVRALTITDKGKLDYEYDTLLLPRDRITELLDDVQKPN